MLFFGGEAEIFDWVKMNYANIVWPLPSLSQYKRFLLVCYVEHDTDVKTMVDRISEPVQE